MISSDINIVFLDIVLETTLTRQNKIGSHLFLNKNQGFAVLGLGLSLGDLSCVQKQAHLYRGKYKIFH